MVSCDKISENNLYSNKIENLIFRMDTFFKDSRLYQWILKELPLKVPAGWIIREAWGTHRNNCKSYISLEKYEELSRTRCDSDISSAF